MRKLCPVGKAAVLTTCAVTELLVIKLLVKHQVDKEIKRFDKVVADTITGICEGKLNNKDFSTGGFADKNCWRHCNKECKKVEDSPEGIFDKETDDFPEVDENMGMFGAPFLCNPLFTADLKEEYIDFLYSKIQEAKAAGKEIPKSDSKVIVTRYGDVLPSELDADYIEFLYNKMHSPAAGVKHDLDSNEPGALDKIFEEAEKQFDSLE